MELCEVMEMQEQTEKSKESVFITILYCNQIINFKYLNLENAMCVP
jgi:hypothetical protein